MRKDLLLLLVVAPAFVFLIMTSIIGSLWLWSWILGVTIR